jgi:hypothetical protein
MKENEYFLLRIPSLLDDDLFLNPKSSKLAIEDKDDIDEDLLIITIYYIIIILF